MIHRCLVASAVTALLMVTAACNNGEPQGVTLVVSVAASLGSSFEAIATAFERANSGVSVQLNEGSSSQLARQIIEGAPADVVAFAGVDPMVQLRSLGFLAGDPTVIAMTRMAITTPPGNPEQVESLTDLTRLDVVALCAPDAPCGRYADTILTRAKVTLPEGSITRLPDSAATASSVRDGDADAAIVYLTNARSAGAAVTTIEIPESQNIVATYQIAALEMSRQPDTAEAFVRFAIGAASQRALRDAGFEPPP